MRILHLFSDWKWTGPAEPVLSLCENLQNEGVDVVLAYRKTPIDFPERTVDKEASKRGIRCYEGLRLNRYFSARDWAPRSDIFRPLCRKGKVRRRPYAPFARLFYCYRSPVFPQAPSAYSPDGPQARRASLESFHVLGNGADGRPRHVQPEACKA